MEYTVCHWSVSLAVDIGNSLCSVQANDQHRDLPAHEDATYDVIVISFSEVTLGLQPPMWDVVTK